MSNLDIMMKLLQVALFFQLAASYQLQSILLESAFSIKPVFKLASVLARNSILKQGKAIGVDWIANTRKLESQMNYLQDCFTDLKQDIVYPGYYLKPFHAYDEGNLSWQAAMEVESAALTVHAHVYTPNRSILDINGDFILRNKFHENMINMLIEKKCRPIKDVVDIGCSTGISTLKLHNSFPSASIIGVDLSPYMLSVARLQLNEDNHKSAKSHIEYMHAMGEDTRLPDSSADLVAVCLVQHELPEAASRNIYQEAYRILRTGGAIAIMDMDPTSESFQKLANNAIAFSAFRSTEPWINEYASMDMMAVLKLAGFSNIEFRSNSPRHRTVVGLKE